MADIIITPSTGKIEFVDNSAQNIRKHAFSMDEDGLSLDAPLAATSIKAPLNIINVNVDNSNTNYPFVLASGSAVTGIKTLMMDGAGGTYNPFTNIATIDISGNSATTTLASNSTNLGGVAAASYVTLTGTQTLTNKTITGTFTGNLTGTGSWATNAVSAVSATNSTQLNGQAASYYTDIVSRLGYTPVNQAGGTVTGNLTVNGNFAVNGSFTAFSASNVYISSSQLYIEDNILTLNAFSPYLRYAGVEMYDSGSGTLSSLLWDGEADYFFLTGSSVNGKIITGPDGQTNLTSGYIPKATAGYKLGNSLIYDNGTNVGIGTTSPSSPLTVQSNGTQLRLQTTNEPAAYFANIGARYDSSHPFTIEVSNGAATATEYFGIYADAGGANNRIALLNSNVGIGTIAPNEKLDVIGRLKLNNSGYGWLYGYDTNHSIILRGNRDGTALDESNYHQVGGTLSSGKGHKFWVGGVLASQTLKMQIASDGVYIANNLGIGTTLPGALLELSSSTAASLLNVKGAGGNNVLYVSGSGAVGIGTTSITDGARLTIAGETRIASSAAYFTHLNYLDGGNNIISSANGGSTVFRGSSNNITVMTILGSGNVGIGTSSPGGKFEIRTDAASNYIFSGSSTSGYTTTFTMDDTASYFGHDSSVRSLILRTNSTSRLTVKGDGNVGIGTTNPVSKLEVSGSVTATSFTGSLSGSITSALTASYLTPANSYTVTNLNASATGSFGMVGIGTTSPASKLHIDDASTPYITITRAGVPTWQLRNNFPNNQYGFSFNNTTAGTVPLFIGTGGNIGIGLDNPTVKLDIASTQGNGIVMRYDTSTAYQAWIRPYWNSNTDSRIDFAINRTANVTPDVIMSVGYGGNVGIGTTAPSATLTIVATNNTGSRIQLGTASTSPFMAANTVNDFMVLTAPFGASPASVSNGGAKWGIKMNGSIDNINVKSKTAAIYAVSEETGAGYNRSVGLALHTSGFDLDNAERLRINSVGNVGIGTTSPGVALHVERASGDSTATFKATSGGAEINLDATNGYAALKLYSSGTEKWRVGQVGDSTGFQIFQGGIGNRVYINSSGNVGIGTTNPIFKFQVVGSAYVNNGTLYIDSGNSLTWGNSTQSILGTNDVGLSFNAGSATRMFVSSSGNIGIGTTSPAARLDVRPNTPIAAYQGTVPYQTTTAAILSPVMAAASTDTYTSILQLVSVRQALVAGRYAHGYLGFSTVDNSNISGILDAGRISIKNDDGVGLLSATSMGFWTNTGGSASNPATERVRIASDGNVGIGTTSPTAKLHVVGDEYVTGNVTIGLTSNYSNLNFIRNGGSAVGGVGWRSDGYFYVGGHPDYGPGAGNDVRVRGFGGSLILGTNSTDYVYLNTSGNVGIGTTSPAAKLNISLAGVVANTVSLINVSSWGNNTVQLFNSNGGTTGNEVLLLGTQAGGNGQLASGFGFGRESSATWGTYISLKTHSPSTSVIDELYERMRIAADGNVGIGTTSPGTLLNVHGATPFVRINTTATADHGIKISYGNSDTHGLHLLYNANSAVSYIDNTYPVNAGFVYGDIYFRQNVAGTMTTRMTIKADGGGNVGIGTTSPGYKLDVNGPIGISGFRFVDQSTHYFRIFEPAGNIALYLGNATDPANYYDNTSHTFRNRGGSSNYVTINSSGNVGIGTTSPASRLHVVGSEAYIRVTDSDDSGVFFIGNASGFGYIRAFSRDFRFLNAAGVSLINIASGGNIGIGTTGPSARLHVFDSNESPATGNLLVTSTGGNASIRIDSQNTSKYTYFTLSQGGVGKFELGITPTSSDLYINHNVQSGANGAAIYIKKADGNVGIGTTAPGAPLTIYKASNPWIRVNGGGAFSYIQLDDGASYGYLFKNTSSDTSNGALAGAMYTYTDSGKAFQHIHSGTPLFTILSGGNVGIGSTSPGYKLDVVGDINFSSTLKFGGINVISNASGDVYLNGRVIRNESNSSQDGMYIGYNSTGTTNAHIRFYANAGNERMRIQANDGNVGIGTTSAGKKLDVEGVVRTRGASGTGGFEIGAATTGAAKWRIEWDSASDSLDFNWVG